MGSQTRLIGSSTRSLTSSPVMKVLLLFLLLIILVGLHVEATNAEEERHWTGINGKECTTQVKQVCKNWKGLKYKKMKCVNTNEKSDLPWHKDKKKKKQLRKKYCKNVVFILIHQTLI